MPTNNIRDEVDHERTHHFLKQTMERAGNKIKKSLMFREMECVLTVVVHGLPFPASRRTALTSERVFSCEFGKAKTRTLPEPT